jgi:hypothetical protein
MYGAPFGAVVAPFAYATLVQAIGFKRAVLPATLGTLAGGFLGSVLGGPIIAQLTGIVGFFFALLLARIHFGVVRRDSWL